MDVFPDMMLTCVFSLEVRCSYSLAFCSEKANVIIPTVQNSSAIDSWPALTLKDV